MQQRVIFARVGWMTYYNGAREERPRGGGSYNEKNIGSELFNFKPAKGYLHGFVNAGSKGERALNLRRIDPTTPKGAETLDNVMVVFVARNPEEGRQYVIGWYENATVYAMKRTHPLKASYKKRVVYCLRAHENECCLLPTAARRIDIPRGKGGMGRSNVRYSHDQRGRFVNKPWIDRALDFVRSYAGPNLLEGPEAEAETNDPGVIAIEKAAGFETNPKIRRAVEVHAMAIAERHFTKLGYGVKTVGKPYDLLCNKKHEVKYVEVKGTRTKGAAVALTRNEVNFLKKNAGRAALFVVHSIQLRNTKKPQAYGGKTKIVEPWDPDCGVLQAITFFLRFK